MTSYTATTTVPQDVTDTFDFIKDPENLPSYFPRMTQAVSVGPELVRTTAVVDANQDGQDEPVVTDAWFHVDDAEHTISWGSPGESDYHGSLELDEGDGATTLRLSLTTVHDIPEVQQGLDGALAAIASRLQELSDSETTGA